METLTEIRFDTLPTEYEVFLSLAEKTLHLPEHAAGLFVIALRIYAVDQELGRKMIAFLRHEDSLSETEEKKLLSEPLRKASYIPLSYFKGASAENGYTPAEPYTVTVKDNRLKSRKRNEKTLYLGCGGSGTYRPITLFKVKYRKLKNRHFEDDAWFIKDYASLMLPISLPRQKELKEPSKEMA